MAPKQRSKLVCDEYLLFIQFSGRCKVTFIVPPRHNWEIVSIYKFDLLGDYSKGCEGGDYVQFTVNGKKAEKFCGEGTELSDDWCWEDYCFPNTFEVVGSPDKPSIIEADFKTSDTSQGYRSGFEIIVAPGIKWATHEPEVNQDGIPLLPMLE